MVDSEESALAGPAPCSTYSALANVLHSQGSESLGQCVLQVGKPAL